MKILSDIILPLDVFPYIPYWFTLRQALAEMEDIEKTEGSSKYIPWIILVFDAQNRLLGIVQRSNILQSMRLSMRDKISGIYPSTESNLNDPNLVRLGFSKERALQDLKGQFARQIMEFMTPIQLTLDINDSILLAINLMIDYNLTFIAVTKNNEVVGIIYIEDALHEVITDLA